MMTKLQDTNLLITGGDGQLGWDLQRLQRTQKIKFTALSKEQLDITQTEQIAQSIKTYKPTMIINTAAYTAVDRAEEEQDLAYQCNAEGPALLAQQCKKYQISLIHLSTDYVFSGNKQAPYLETDNTDPINIYGETKLQGELEIQRHLPEHIILRVSGVFGMHGHNFVKTMIRLAKEREQLQVVNDQITCPTPAADIADVILQIIEKLPSLQNPWGIYHYCASEPISWYQFATAIIDEAKHYTNIKTKEIKPLTSQEFKCLAKRPLHSVLECTKIQKIFNIKQKPWHTGLKHMIRELEI